MRQNLQLRVFELAARCDGCTTTFAMEVWAAKEIAIIANERPKSRRAALGEMLLRSLGRRCVGKNPLARIERIGFVRASDAFVLDVESKVESANLVRRSG